MAGKLHETGYEVRRILSISDKTEAIHSALESSLHDADLVLMTGGLGPTRDDITKAALCSFFNCELVFNEEVFNHISGLFTALNKPMKEAHRNQAMVPSACTPLTNRFGTAPGMMFKTHGKTIVSMPGVPYEMKGLMEDHVLPMLTTSSDEQIVFKTLLTANVPESIISEQLTDFEDNLPSYIKLAYLPNYNFVRLRLTAKYSGVTDLNKEVENLAEKIKTILGEVVISEEDITIQQLVGKILKQRKQTMSLAESCTGGYVAHMITSVAGSSAYFPGSVVTYSYENKTEVLGVDSEILWQVGAVSEEVVEKMAKSVRQKYDTDYSLALSGIAGPDGGTKDKPVGTVWIAVCSRDRIYSKKYQLKGNRIQNIERSGHLGLEMLRKLIVGELE